MDDHAFTARTEAVDSTPAASFFVGCSVGPLLGPFRTRKAGATCFAYAVFRKSWKSRSFEETSLRSLSTTSSSDAGSKVSGHDEIGETVKGLLRRVGVDRSH